jgi:hypothetical protein
LEIHFLPGDALERSPDESVWNHQKKGVGKMPLKKHKSLKSRVESDLGAI